MDPRKEQMIADMDRVETVRTGRTFAAEPQTVAAFKEPRKRTDYTFFVISALALIMLLLMLTGCGEPGDQPVAFTAAAIGTQSGDNGTPGQRDTRTVLANKLIGQIQRLNVGSADLELDCPAGVCAAIPEARLECFRGTAVVRSDESPDWCRLVP